MMCPRASAHLCQRSKRPWARAAVRSPRLDRVSWDTMRGNAHADPSPEVPDAAAPNNYDTGAPNDASPTPEAALWIALCAAPPEGWSIGDLIRSDSPHE